MEDKEKDFAKVSTKNCFKELRRNSNFGSEIKIPKKARKSGLSHKMSSPFTSLKRFSSNLMPSVEKPADFEDSPLPEIEAKSDESSVEIDGSSHKQNCRLVKEFATREFQNEMYRPYMEDRILVKDELTSKIALFAVFDGHGGQSVVDFVVDNFQSNLEEQLEIEEDLQTALSASMNKLQDTVEVFLEQSESQGCTATILIISENKAVLGFLGDSPCFLVREGIVSKLTTDHNCTNKEEVARVKKAGCAIIKKKMMGSLSLTRALGDTNLREFGLISTLEFSETTLKPGDTFILGSDGAFDKISQDAILTSIGQDTLETAENILCESLGAKSRDNISIITVQI